jgi:hypothetical protein
MPKTWGRSLQELQDAGLDQSWYYLTSDGHLEYRSRPLELLEKPVIYDKSGRPWDVIAQWRMSEVVSDVKVFMEFLKEAKRLGARDSEIIRLCGDSFLDRIYPDCLRILNIQGKIRRSKPKPRRLIIN